MTALGSYGMVATDMTRTLDGNSLESKTLSGGKRRGKGRERWKNSMIIHISYKQSVRYECSHPINTVLLNALPRLKLDLVSIVARS